MKRITLSVCCMLFVLVATAQIRGNEIRVVVSPNHLDWVYDLNEKCTFTIQVMKAQNPLPGVTIDYDLGPEMYPTESKKGVVLKDGTLTVSATMKTAGFLRCKVRAYVNGKSYSGLATAAYAPESLKPVAQMPEDFTEFWTKTLERARRMPLRPTMTLLPDRCTELDNVYEVSFSAGGWNSRFYGILTVPKADGKYPALLRVPGAGVRPYSGDTSTAPGRLITLEVGVHGISVTMPQQNYDNLSGGALSNYWTFRWDDRSAFYLNRVVVGCLRAVDFICSLPQYNGKALAVTGSSQGGFLTVATAALDKRVTALAAVHPALCDHEGYKQNRASGWPQYVNSYRVTDEKVLETVRYYDTANFARLLTQPGWYSWGYNDETCPPTTMHATYNIITAPKELQPYLETGHYWYQEQWDTWVAWLRKQLGL